MLVLTRCPGEEIVIDGGIRITVVGLRGGRVRIGVTAPPSVSVDRQEVHQRRAQFLAPSADPVPAPGARPAVRIRPAPVRSRTRAAALADRVPE